MKQRVLIIVLFLSFGSFSQTKTIAHKRHNGSKLTFSESLKNDGFDAVFSNFGVGPTPTIRHSELKKVILINDSTAAMVTEASCYYRRDVEKEHPELWRAGTDTVVNHPVFSADISVDSMRTILKKTYYFANNISNVKFIGFEERTKNKETQTDNRKPTLNPTSFPKNTPSTNWSKWFLLIVASSSVVGIIRLK